MTLIHHSPMEAKNAQRDHLWPQISSLPYFRGLLRAVESRFYENIDLPAPTLDLGCGDGHFASLAFPRRLEVGLDPWPGPLREAFKRGVYGQVVESDGHAIPYPDASFSSAVSNSVLEHIEELSPVLAELARVLQPGAQFIFCVPNQRFLNSLSVAQFFDCLHLKPIAKAYHCFFNRISRHHHCDDLQTWQQRLAEAGFELVDHWDYFSPRSQHVLEWGHYFGLPSLVTKRLLGRWVVAPYKWNLFFTWLITRGAYAEDSVQTDGVYTFYITRRSGRGAE